MSDNTSNNRRIAKNTLALYIRTFITMIVGLYTSRVMLQALGVDDFGINSVVGGIVAMSSLLTGAVSSSITRFITYALGEGDKHRMRVVFSNSVNVMIAMSVVAVIALELIGVWFLYTKADIPDGRMDAAQWVLQFSIITLVLNLISTPYNATIVAHEHMSIYAYMSIVEVLLKLGVCYAIMSFGGDRLILFAILNAGVALCLRLFYSWYCQHRFDEAIYDIKLLDKSFLKEMLQFTGWFMVGNAVWVLNTQGVNMLINVFFGVVLNAARGIAVTVTGAITTFVNNFTVAFVPQITKSYASGDKDRLLSLIFKGTTITWYLIFLLIIPIFWEADTLLRLWLGTPPEYAGIFLRFALFESWSMGISFALHNTILATGKLKRVQLQIAVFTSFIFPITWLCFLAGASAWTSCIVFVVMNTASKGFTLYELKRLIDFPVAKFLRQCVLRCSLVTLVAFALPGVIVYLLPQTTTRFFIVISTSIAWTLSCAYSIGLSKSERITVNAIVKKLYSKISNR